MLALLFFCIMKVKINGMTQEPAELYGYMNEAILSKIILFTYVCIGENF